MTAPALSWLEPTWPPAVEADSAAGFLMVMAAAAVQPVVLEAVGETGVVRHRLGVPAGAAAHVVRQGQAAIEGLALTPVSRPVPVLELAVRLRPSSSWRPLAVPAAGAAEPILTALAAARNGERLVLQWVLGRPLSPLVVPDQVPRDVVGPWWHRILNALLLTGADLDASARRSLRAKRSERAWRMGGRIAVQAATPARRSQLVRGVLAAVRTTDGPGVGWRARRERPGAAATASLPRRHGQALNIHEVLMVSGWPLGELAALPVVQRAARLLPAAPALRAGGRVVGVSTWPGQPRAVGLSAVDGLRGLHVVGPVGVGKSTLLLNLIAADMEQGRGVVVIDPKGDLIEATLARVPPGRVDDVVVVAPTDRTAPVGLNPFAAGRAPDVTADLLLGIFRQLFADAWGPRTQDILHASLLTLARSGGQTLAALPLLLSDAGFRRRLVGTLDDPLGVSAFWTTFEAWSDAEKVSYTAPALTRLRPFLMRPPLRAMLGQAEPRWSPADAFTGHRIVLVDLARGPLGSETASLLGSLIVAEVWQAALARAAIPADRRRPVFLYADEFQDYLHYGHDVEDALVQARGHGLGLVLAHQHLAQLPTAVRAAVLANARSRILFQLGADDARAVTSGDPRLTPADLQSLPAFEAYARLVADGAAQPWCSIRTPPEPPPVSDPAAIRRRSRERYGVPAEDTEAALRALLTNHRPSAANRDDLRPRRRRNTTGDAS